VLDTLRNQAEVYKLTFAPDPSTHNRCTIGGMIGNNSCGTHSLLGGKTVDNVEELRILLYDGTQMTVGPATTDEDRILQQGRAPRRDLHRAARDRQPICGSDTGTFPQIPRRVSGYNLDDLLPERFNVARALVGTKAPA
jgi:FAD/FMN-containing dehydrogenase